MRSALFPFLCMCFLLSGCSPVSRRELSYAFKETIGKKHWVSAKFPNNVLIEPQENWAIEDDNGNYYYWRNTEENKLVFEEWLKYTRKHRIGTAPFMYGIYAGYGRLLFSKNVHWVCSSDGLPYVEFFVKVSPSYAGRMRRANKYDRKLGAVVNSLTTKDNAMTPEDAARIEQLYFRHESEQD